MEDSEGPHEQQAKGVELSRWIQRHQKRPGEGDEDENEVEVADDQALLCVKKILLRQRHSSCALKRELEARNAALREQQDFAD